MHALVPASYDVTRFESRYVVTRPDLRNDAAMTRFESSVLHFVHLFAQGANVTVFAVLSTVSVSCISTYCVVGSLISSNVTMSRRNKNLKKHQANEALLRHENLVSNFSTKTSC